MKRERDDEVVDLAEFHKPIGDFLSLSDDVWPVTRESYEKYALTQDQLNEFHEEGFIDGIQILNEAQIQVLKQDLDELKVTCLVVAVAVAVVAVVIFVLFSPLYM